MCFEVNAGARQGCILSPILFLITIDWALRNAWDVPRGIPWDPGKFLEELGFADDLALLAETLENLQLKTLNLQKFAAQTGLIINVNKTKTLHINDQIGGNIIINNEPVERVDDFVYLGSVLSNSDGTRKDIRNRIDKASASYAILKPIWKSNKINLRTKLRIYSSNVKSVLLYGSECWRNNKNDFHKLDVFHNRCLRRLSGIFWPQIISNENLHKLTNEKSISYYVKRSRLRWLGHTLRMDLDRLPKQALTWTPTGARARGRPRATWRRTIESDLDVAGIPWNEAEQLAQNRTTWKRVTAALCSNGNEEL